MTSLFLFLLSVLHAAQRPEKLVVYSYDSLAGKEGLSSVVSEAFRKKSGKEIEWVFFSSSGEALNQVAIEKKAPRADVLVGVDQFSLARAKELAVFRCGSHASARADLVLDPDGCFTPYDYGYFAFVYDSRRFKDPLPDSLASLSQDPKLRKRIVISDPRTSSAGLGLLAWSVETQGPKWTNWWKAFSSQVVTVSPGWSGAYGLFLKGEADLVLSYTTSPAYHVEKENNKAIRALLFSEGHLRQIEGMGILKTSKHPGLANAFRDVLLSAQVQKQIPLTQWMYPVLDGVPLPESFSSLPAQPKALGMSPMPVPKKKEWLRQWTAIMAAGA